MNKKKLVLFLIFIAVLFVTTDVLAVSDYTCPGTNLKYVGCGQGSSMVTGIPEWLPRLVSFGVTLMKVIIPIVLIITGTIEMFKSIISGNPDNIAKCRKRVINKYIGALLAFFIVSFTTNIVKLIARGNEKSTAASCFNCYLNNKCVKPIDNPEVCKGISKDEEIEQAKTALDNYNTKDSNQARAQIIPGSSQSSVGTGHSNGSQSSTDSKDTNQARAQLPTDSKDTNQERAQLPTDSKDTNQARAQLPSNS